MSERRKSPADASAWNWFGGLARAQGLDLEQMPLAEAAERIVSQLEECRASGLPVSANAVQLASWLVRLLGELLLSEVSSAGPLIERVYTRERAKWLATQMERGPLLEPKPEIGKPEEPEQSETFTLYDLIGLCEALARNAKHLAISPAQDSR